jgi:MSHA biogenesis protein MshK
VFNKINLWAALAVLMISLTSQSAQDPMRPPSWMSNRSAPVVINTDNLELQQILISTNRKLAIINESVVKEGEIIAGAKILKITKQWVKVKRQGRILTLKISPATKEYRREK